MATIIVQGPHDAKAEITRSETESSYLIECACGDSWTAVYSVDEALNSAEIHVDNNCPYRYEKRDW